MSFAVKHAVKKEVSGTFRLLPQAAGRSQHVPVAPAAPAAPAGPAAPPQAANNNQQQQQQLDGGVSSAGPAGPAPDVSAVTLPSQEQERALASAVPLAERRRAMFSSRTMESVTAPTATTTVERSEDSTFLRHLELEPTDGALPTVPLPLHPQAAARPPGRTPFTSTRRLQRAPGGFGFSVAWTQPPRVERVEPGLPAEQAGIRPGDYIIFVDRHNVVTVPEEDVLQLIRSCGNQLTLEVYRRNSPNGMVPQSKSTPAVSAAAKVRPGVPASASTSSALLSKAVTASAVAAPTPLSLIPGTAPGTPATSHRHQPPAPPEPRPSTACSATTVATGTNASDMGKRRLHLPQVTFTSEAPGQLSAEEGRKRAVYQLLSKEQSYSLALQFGISRFLNTLSERRDLIGPQEHQTLFQNIQEILRITEEVLERLIQEDGEPLVSSVAQVYTAVCPRMTLAYHRYCSGLKHADALLVTKTRNPEFMRTLNDPPVPRRRPDITAFLHKPLEHYREILKLLQTIHNFTRHSDDDYPLLTKAVHEFQAAYRGLTTSSGIMEPEGEGRPLLTLQDVEARLVFTKCKPFSLAASGRRWIFGGDLVRIEGRSERRYWALLFTDLLLFSQVSRDRVLFISEEPLRLITITQAAFSVKRRPTEFRLMVDGSTSPSPTGCGDAAKKTKKSDRRRTIVLRAASAEHKAVWQNLIQRQIIYLNTVRGGTPAGSPLDSPEPPSLSLTTADSLRDGLLRRGHPGHQVRDGVPYDVLDEEYEASLTLADDELQSTSPAPPSISPPPPATTPPPPHTPPPAQPARPQTPPSSTASPEHSTLPAPAPRPRHKVPGRLYSTFPPRPKSSPPPALEPVMTSELRPGEDPYAITIADLPQPPSAPVAPGRRTSTASKGAPAKPARKASTGSRKPSVDGAVASSSRPTKPSTLLPPTARSTRSSSTASSHSKADKSDKVRSRRDKDGKKQKNPRPTSTLAFHSPSSPGHDLPSCPPSLPPSTAPSPAPTPGSRTGSLFLGNHANPKPVRKPGAPGANALAAPSTSSTRRRCS